MNIVGGVLLIAWGTFMLWRRRSFAKGMVRLNREVARSLPWVYHGLGKLWLSEDFYRAQIVGAGLLCIALGGYFLVVPSD
jgi:hypothetical protein